jgi:predicted nuclease of predicted toxin-antitoxin system
LRGSTPPPIPGADAHRSTRGIGRGRRPRVRFLIDECLHTSLTQVADESGYEAYHVVYRGWSGLEDHELRPIILREEFVFVTNNGRDFRELFENTELHPGLVIIVPNDEPPVQMELFRAAVEEITPSPAW